MTTPTPTPPPTPPRRLTPERIAELQALCEAATPGPWNTTHDIDDLARDVIAGEVEIVDGNIRKADWIAEFDRQDGDEDEEVVKGWNRDNAAFCAAARTALPDALADLVAAREEIEALSCEVANRPKALWTCSVCAFAFDAVHEDSVGGYSCPVCDIVALGQSAKAAAAEIARLREALEFYAAPPNWVREDSFSTSDVDDDEGDRARAALEGKA
jgi:hypothetical protein